jgi:hypothetical protein
MSRYKIKQAAVRAKSLNADVVGGVMEEIVERTGSLTPEALVDAAKPKKHPLHDYFMWDDAQAGREYREHQANYLIRAVVRVEEEGDREVRAFVSVIPDEDGESGTTAVYQPIMVVFADVELRKQVLHSALKELEAWQRKYRDLEELVDVIRAADQLLLKEVGMRQEA